jgi:hypothetical protein
MATANFIVTSLPAYVEENRDLLLKNFGLVGGSIRNRIGIQTGIKLKEHLNYLEVTPTLQDGLNCELEPAGGVELTNREIETAWIEVLIAICPKKLAGKWAEYLVRANANAESLPFEQYIIDGFIAEVNRKIEKLIFQGDKTLTTNPDLKWINGFVKVFQTDGTEVTIPAAATTILAKLQALYAGLDDYTLERGAEIYVSPANYRAFLQELVSANLFHYPSAESGTFPKEFFLPGTDVKVVLETGLEGVNNIALASFPDNLRYGCDMENDQEDVAVKYDPIKELFYVKALWNSGVQVAFPGKAYWATI